MGPQQNPQLHTPRSLVPEQTAAIPTQNKQRLRISEHRDRPFRLIVTGHFANA